MRYKNQLYRYKYRENCKSASRGLAIEEAGLLAIKPTCGMKNIIFVAFLILTIPLYGEFKRTSNPVDETSEEEKSALFTKEMVAYTIKNIKKTVLKGMNSDGKTPLKAMQLFAFSRSFDIYVKDDRIEKVTKISRNWFKKCRDALKLMFKPKGDMDTAILNRDKKAFKKAKIEYNKLLKKFKKLIKNPVKAKKKKKSKNKRKNSNS